jgi:cell wall-associated NlpC family hydrolase
MLNVIRQVAKKCRERADACAAAVHTSARQPYRPRHRQPRARDVLTQRGRRRLRRWATRRSRRAVIGTLSAVFRPRTRTGGIVLVVILLLLFGLVTPSALWSGAKQGGGFIIGGSAYGCTEQEGPSGIEGAAYRAGTAIRTVAEWEPEPVETREFLMGVSEQLGRAWGTFRLALDGDPRALPPAPLDDPAQRVANEACCTPPSDAIPANNPTDTPADTAARAVLAAGWADPLTALMVAGAESGYDPLAANPTSTARGLFQTMMSLHGPLYDGADWRDPYANARVARVIYEAQGWGAWVVYTSGAYRAWEDEAREALARVQQIAGPRLPVQPAAADPVVPASTCVPTTYDPTSPAPSPSAEAAVQFALAQRGEPYVWGAEGPDSWDCSGLVIGAYRLSGRPTTATLINMGTRVTPGEELRGDLIFTSPGHVGIALGNGEMVAAPRAGDVVKISGYGRPWAVVRLGGVAT